MIDQYFSFEDTQYSKLNIAYEEAIRNISADLLVKELDWEIAEILNSIKECSNEYILPFQIKLLKIALNKKLREGLHISFTRTLKELEYDEIMILKNVHFNNYEFVATYDYEEGKGFYNFKYHKFDLPKEELNNEANFWFYIHHLQDILNIIKWPIYNQEVIRENGKQTGSVQYSRLIETEYGLKFNKCLFD